MMLMLMVMIIVMVIVIMVMVVVNNNGKCENMVMVKLMAMVILTKPVWEEASDPLISLVDKKTNLIYLIEKDGQRDQFLHEAITDD